MEIFSPITRGTPLDQYGASLRSSQNYHFRNFYFFELTSDARAAELYHRLHGKEHPDLKGLLPNNYKRLLEQRDRR